MLQLKMLQHTEFVCACVLGGALNCGRCIQEHSTLWQVCAVVLRHCKGIQYWVASEKPHDLLSVTLSASSKHLVCQLMHMLAPGQAAASNGRVVLCSARDCMHCSSFPTVGAMSDD